MWCGVVWEGGCMRAATTAAASTLQHRTLVVLKGRLLPACLPACSPPFAGAGRTRAGTTLATSLPRASSLARCSGPGGWVGGRVGPVPGRWQQPVAAAISMSRPLSTAWRPKACASLLGSSPHPCLQRGHRPAVRARVPHHRQGGHVLATAHLQGEAGWEEGATRGWRSACWAKVVLAASQQGHPVRHSTQLAMTTLTPLPAPACLPCPALPCGCRWWRWTAPTSRSSPRAAPAAGQG